MSSHVQESYCVVSARIDRIFDRFDFLCVVALALCFIVTSQLSFGASKFSDMYFHAEAKALSQAVRGYGSWNDVSFARAPGPVLYYGVPYTLVQPDSGDDVYWRAGFAWNAFWMLCALLLIRRTAELFWNATAGRIAALLFLLTPFAVYYSFGISGETPAYVAAVLFLWMGEISREPGRREPAHSCGNCPSGVSRNAAVPSKRGIGSGIRWSMCWSPLASASGPGYR